MYRYLILIAAIGGFLRFFKLDWGNGLFTHPDEYHIVSSVLQLQFPSQMNPHFFSYGTVVIYLIYFTKVILRSFDLNIFLIGRFYSALFSTLTIPIFYFISSFMLTKKWSLLATFLLATSPGLIQQAHFATPESTLIFYIFSSLLGFLYFNKTGKLKFLILSSIFVSLAIGTKIVALLIVPVFLIFIALKNFRLIPIFLFVTIISYAITSPFVFIDFTSWKNNILYEGSIADGSNLVFYTRQFLNTIPFLFQFEKILPFTLGPAVLILSIGGILLFASNLKKLKSSEVIVFLAFIAIFVSNSLLFTKWTRFISPAFPFFTLYAAYFLQNFSVAFRKITPWLLSITVVISLAWTIAFYSIYLNPDVRLQASDWVISNIPRNSSILVESGNMVDIPLRGDYQKTSFDFYPLNEDPSKITELISELQKADYFIIQSRRVFANDMRVPDKFPKSSNFYKNLFNGALGFKQMEEINSVPRINFLDFNVELQDEFAEETWSVFDHPAIRIYKKEASLTQEEYARILEI